MATIKINTVDKRLINLTVVWENEGNPLTGTFDVPNCPVEDIAETQAYLFQYVSSKYDEAVRLDAAEKYANPTIAPEVLAAVGHTFDDEGNVLS